MEIKVAIFEDNKTLRESLQQLINSAGGMVCTGACPDANKLHRNLLAADPDVVMMDINMPGLSGIDAVKVIREEFPHVQILMQTVFDDDEKIFAAIYAGADGYLLKKAHPVKLIEGILEVMQGGAPMTPSVARQVLNLFNGKHRKKSSTDFNLSERETEILSLLVKGMSYKKIADTYFGQDVSQ